MTKYNRIDEPVRKAKNTINVIASMQAHEEAILKDNVRTRTFNESMDKNLLQFGIDLYEHGYSLSDVKMDMELCVAMRDNNREYDSSKSMFSYEGIENVPTFKQVLAMADNPNLFMNVENGYNIAYRRALASNLASNKSNKR